MNSFEDIAKKEYEKSNNDSFPFIFEEKQYWLKKARATKPDKIQAFKQASSVCLTLYPRFYVLYLICKVLQQHYL